jgi:alcohol dehydrogenase (cytochrome c)
MAQTADDLAKGAAADTNNVLNYRMGYDLNRFSPLEQINKDNVKRLVSVWNYSYDDNRSEESQPLVYKGVLYVTTNNATMAIDAKTGRQIWKTKVEYPPEVSRILCCGIINRGAAIYDARSSEPRSTMMSSHSMLRPARNSGAKTRSSSRTDTR